MAVRALVGSSRTSFFFLLRQALDLSILFFTKQILLMSSTLPR
jgi:hypothetical protein